MQRADIDLQNQRVCGRAEQMRRQVPQAFRDKRTDQYYVGWIDPQERSHELHSDRHQGHASTTYFVQHGEPKLEIDALGRLPVRARRDDALYDLASGFINR